MLARRARLASERRRVEGATEEALFSEYLRVERELRPATSAGAVAAPLTVGVTVLPPLEAARGDADALRRALAGPEQVLLLVREGDAPRGAAAALAARAFEADPALCLVAFDEEHAAPDGRVYPVLRPGWSDDLFLGAFDPGAPLAIRTAAARSAGGADAAAGSAAFFDLALRLPGTRRAIPRWLARRGDPGRVEPGFLPGVRRIRRPLPPGLAVTVVIPTRDGGSRPLRCVESLRRLPPGPRLEIVLVDNGSGDPATLEILAELSRDPAVRVLRRPGTFNFSAMMNAAAKEAGGELVLFLNDDTEARSPEAVSALCEEALRPDVAAAGGLLTYPDGRIQHAGLVLGMGVVAGHAWKGFTRSGPRWFTSPLVSRDVGAVDGACFMTRRELFLRLGGFDEARLPVSFGDVDFCLRARGEGFRAVYTPHSEFLHEETATRDPELNPREIATMERRWAKALARDPYFHPGLTTASETGRPDPFRHAILREAGPR